MKLGSLFAGIGGFDLGFERVGFETKWQVEIDPFCNKILERHFPKAKRYGDIIKLDPAELEKVDVITGGFPCQDLSVAGKRKGLSGERSGLFYELKRIIAGVRPAWFVVENVPGLFSSNRGRDFGLVLFHLAECGYGLSWRILDSRYFGVAQRRRRVFIVGCLGGACPSEILFESEGVRRDSAKVGAERGDTSRCLAGSTRIDYETETFVNAPLRSGGDGGVPSPRNPDEGIVIVPTLYASGAGTERTASAGNEAGFCIPVADKRLKGNEGLGIGQNGEPSYCLENHTPQVAYQLRANPSKADKPTSTTYVGAEYPKEEKQPLTLEGFRRIIELYADAIKADTDKILSFLREVVESEAGAGRGFRELAPFWTKEILQPELYGKNTVGTEKGKCGLVGGPSSRPPNQGKRAVRKVRLEKKNGCPSQGRELAEQQPGESGTPLPLLPQPETSTAKILPDLWQTPEGQKSLQQAFHQIQKVWQSFANKNQSEHPRLSVRRLTPKECERLQSFPDDWTLLPDKLDTPDGPRYRALGNAVTVNVAFWIAKRIMAYKAANP